MHYDAGVVEHAANQGSLMAGTTESQKVESKTTNARRVDYHPAARKGPRTQINPGSVAGNNPTSVDNHGSPIRRA
jgi:hypothetical protein